MLTLHTLKNTSRPCKAPKRVGRGRGSKLGKTCGRGNKGAGSRSGYKERHSYEGGQFRLFRKLPVRGFSNAAFKEEFYVINLGQINEWFDDGDTINETSLRDRKLVKGRVDGIKILGDGKIQKKVIIEAHAFSSSAKEKLDAAGISYSVASV
ncbi:MAG: 50S ribosomal protein L15 [Chlamydiales bacterium]|nr:50S ribosomal protein L15 [Chlamydiales bacterium]